jgi:hypothetical protein
MCSEETTHLGDWAGSRAATLEGRATTLDAAARRETRTALVYISMSVCWLEVRVGVFEVG